MPDVIFERIASGTYTLGFVLRIPAGKLDPQTTLTEGATYLDCDLSGLDKPYLNEGFNAFVLAGPPEPTESQDESDPTPWVALTFLKPSDSGPSRAGETYQSDSHLPPSRFLTGVVIENTSQIVPYGTNADDGSSIVRSEVQPLDSVRSRINTSAVLSYDGRPLYSWVLDPETGKGSQVVEQIVAAGTQGSSEVAADGTFADVVPVNPNFSIKTTRKVTTLSSTPRVYMKTERTPILWPAVLVSHSFHDVLATNNAYFQRLLNYTMKEPYTGDVNVEYSEWWQKVAPAPISPTEMLPSAIIIPRLWSPNISIPECLHPEFVAYEDELVGWKTNTGYTSQLSLVAYTSPATNVTDWPNQVVKLDAEPFRGGFQCVKRTIYKPSQTVSGIIARIGTYVYGSGTHNGYT